MNNEMISQLQFDQIKKEEQEQSETIAKNESVR